MLGRLLIFSSFIVCGACSQPTQKQLLSQTDRADGNPTSIWTLAQAHTRIIGCTLSTVKFNQGGHRGRGLRFALFIPLRTEDASHNGSTVKAHGRWTSCEGGPLDSKRYLADSSADDLDYGLRGPQEVNLAAAPALCFVEDT